MATVTFALKEKNASKTPIYAYLRYSGQQVRIPTKISIEPKQWSFTKQRINNKMTPALRGQYNVRLKKFEDDIEAAFTEFINENDYIPGAKEIKPIIVKAIHPEKVTIKSEYPENLKPYWIKYIERLSKSKNVKTGEPIAASTIYDSERALKFVEAYDRKKKKNTDFNDIDLNFYDAFVEFLESKDYSLNYIGKQIKNLKTVMRDATSNGVNTNLKFQNKNFKVLQEETDDIYLTFSELQEIIDLDLSKEPLLSKARDQFILLAYTGQRWSELEGILNPANHDGNFIRLKQEKTVHPIVIPIAPQIRPILERTMNCKRIDNTLLNDRIKDVCSRVPGLNSHVPNEYTKGGEKVVENVKKYTLEGTHTGRRSFATNFYQNRRKFGITLPDIMAITGHTKESNFFKYIRMTNEEHANNFLKAFASSKETSRAV